MSSASQSSHSNAIHRNPSQSIAIRRNPSNPSQSIQYIIVIHPSQSIAIHPSQSTRNPSQSTRNPSQSTRNQSQSTRNPSQRQAHRLNAQHGSNAQHTELTQSWVRTCRRALEWGWGMRRDVEDGEVVMLTASEKLRRRQGLRRGEQRVSDARQPGSPDRIALAAYHRDGRR